MKVKYEINAEDIYQFGKENSPSQKEYNPTVIIFTFTFILFIFADLIYSYFFGVLKDLDFSWLLINILVRFILTFVLILIVLGFIRLMVAKKKQEVLEMGKNAIFCEHQILLNETELIEITDINNSRFSWKAIGEIKESENFIFFELLAAFTYVIPKRYFEDQKHINDFTNTFNTFKQNSLNTYSPSHFSMLDE